MVKSRRQIFYNTCIDCHQFGRKEIGPPLRGILQRRSPEWVMNMLLVPNRILQENPIAQKLMKDYKLSMPYIIEILV